MSYERSEANGSRLGIAKLDNGQLEAKIKEIEDQLEQTRRRKAEVKDVEMREVDKDHSDNVTPQDCTFDDILKNLNIGIATSNRAESVYSRGTNRRRKEWSKRPSRQVSPTKEAQALWLLHEDPIIPDKATVRLEDMVHEPRDESVIGDQQLKELENTIQEVF